ncbi:LADA_0C12882g1_1 [Lachancea dasiensis]|uniref:LADA_0C12882g1_1 n=1 Tax=Lachancea dasiensis TaxID=1072105 RepID=A0A1G4J2H0_9SACH|nr:LADA_0C12882g1_1 [Lachancea dasiensis]
MSKFLRSVAVSFHSSPVPPDLLVLMACVSEADRLDWMFRDDPDASFYDKACGSYLPYMQTTMKCFMSFASEHSKNLPVEARLDEYRGLCAQVTNSSLSENAYERIWSNATRHFQSYLPVPDAALTAPVVIPDNVVLPSLKYYRGTFYNLTAGFTFSLAINGFVAIIILLAVWARHSKSNGKLSRYVRSRVLIPAVFDTTHHSETRVLPFYKVILPTRGEAVTLACFLLANAGLSLYNYPVLSSKMDTKLFFLVRCIANRSGGLAFGLIPMTILLAGRNNFIQQLTGAPYSSLIFFHKWAARTMTFYAVVHSILWVAYVAIRMRVSLWYFFVSFAYWRWGVIATVASAVLVLHSVHILKAKQYEIFLVVHISLALIFLYGCWKHCAEFGWLGWIYLAAGLWVWDRICRAWRFLFASGGYKNAYAQVLSTSDEIFRITVPCVDKRHFKFFPGCYAFVYVNGRKWFWQSHPFTLMNSGEALHVLVRAKNGLTRDIFCALPSDGARLPLRIALEGPYGHEAPLRSYSNVLLLASGAGIPGPASYLQKLIDSHDHCEVIQCTFVWIVPSESLIDTMRDTLLTICKKIGKAHMKIQYKLLIYVTRSQGGNADLEWLPHEIELHKFRPSVETLIQDFCKESSGTIAIVSCANPGLDDLARRYIAQAIQVHPARIDYFDELQVW